MSEDNNIPKHWKIVVSSKIMDIRDGTHDTPKYIQNDGIPLITSKNLKGNKIDFEKVSYISKDDHFEISKRSKVEEGDILFAMIGTIGNPAIIKGDANFSIKNIGLFKKNESVIIPAFFVNYLRSGIFEKQLTERKLLKGTTQKFIPLGNLRNIHIPLPPISEQKAIVFKIEELLSDLENGKQQLQIAHQQLIIYRQSLLKWAFEGKLTNNNVKDGELPKGWKWMLISDLCNVVRGGSPRPAGDPKFYDGNIPFLKVRDITKDSNKYLTTFEYTIKEAGLHKTRQIKPNTLLLSNSGATLGVPKICMIDATMNDGIAAFLDLDKRSNLYLYYFWVSKTRELRNINMGAAQPNLNTDIIKNYSVPIPPLSEQQLIVDELESKLTVCDKIEETISQSLLQAESLRQSILKKAFEGKLV